MDVPATWFFADTTNSRDFPFIVSASSFPVPVRIGIVPAAPLVETGTKDEPTLIVPSGNFFNNWLSIIYYLPVGFILYFYNKE